MVAVREPLLLVSTASPVKSRQLSESSQKQPRQFATASMSSLALQLRIGCEEFSLGWNPWPIDTQTNLLLSPALLSLVRLVLTYSKLPCHSCNKHDVRTLRCAPNQVDTSPCYSTALGSVMRHLEAGSLSSCMPPVEQPTPALLLTARSPAPHPGYAGVAAQSACPLHLHSIMPVNVLSMPANLGASIHGRTL